MLAGAQATCDPGVPGNGSPVCAVLMAVTERGDLGGALTDVRADCGRGGRSGNGRGLDPRKGRVGGRRRAR